MPELYYGLNHNLSINSKKFNHSLDLAHHNTLDDFGKANYKHCNLDSSSSFHGFLCPQGQI